MKRAVINPLFKKFDSTTYDNNIDFTKNGIINVYAASGINQLEKGQKLFDFAYETILKDEEYKKLLTYYDNSILFVELYRRISFIYFDHYTACTKWYIENSKSLAAFNLEAQIKKYELKIQDDFCCPIVRYLDMEMLDNVNIYRNIKTIMAESESKNIDSINILIYGDNELIRINQPPTFNGKILLNSIVNITYHRFLQFLKSVDNTQNKDSSEDTLINIFSENEAKYSVIKSAIYDLNITKETDERSITGFIDGCKQAEALPNISTSKVFRAIHLEINKPILKNSKPRYDGIRYNELLKKTKQYFGI